MIFINTIIIISASERRPPRAATIAVIAMVAVIASIAIITMIAMRS